MTQKLKSKFPIPFLTLFGVVSFILGAFLLQACFSKEDVSKVAGTTEMTVDEVCTAVPFMPFDTAELAHSKRILTKLCADRQRLQGVLVEALRVSSIPQAVDVAQDVKDVVKDYSKPPVPVPSASAPE